MAKTHDQLQNNGAEVLFSDIRGALEKSISHPYIPTWAQDILQTELRHARLLRDDNFEAIAAKQSVTDDEALQPWLQDNIARVNALHIEGRGIIIRRSYFAADPMAPMYGQDLLAEELGHGLR